MRGSWIQSGFGTVASVVADSQRAKESAGRVKARALQVTSFSAGQPDRLDALAEPMECLQCRNWFVPVEGKNAVWAGGFWWCLRHANVRRVGDACVGGCVASGGEVEMIVELPSGGRLNPDSVPVRW